MFSIIMDRFTKKHYTELKNQLDVIKKHFKEAKNYITLDEIIYALERTYSELLAFEEQNKNNIGYTNQIKSEVYSLYHKIDAEKVKYYPNYRKNSNIKIGK